MLEHRRANALSRPATMNERPVFAAQHSNPAVPLSTQNGSHAHMNG